ncbi:hypothetical protein CTU88_21410 [Streptomyces sp. JV178]|nr:hypothetical protein CTU88_21410 [Streptomyces sp. JV178]
MQGQMHVHAPGMDPAVPFPGHFFCHSVPGNRARTDDLPAVSGDLHRLSTSSSTARRVLGALGPSSPHPPQALKTFHFCNRTSADRSGLVADCGP